MKGMKIDMLTIHLTLDRACVPRQCQQGFALQPLKLNFPCPSPNTKKTLRSGRDKAPYLASGESRQRSRQHPNYSLLRCHQLPQRVSTSNGNVSLSPRSPMSAAAR